jgi:signal transduction histidine kinase/ligand-binding sensor domain-containing protein/DNA-binding response OmpR family regulator
MRIKSLLISFLVLSCFIIYSQQLPLVNFTMKEGLSSYYVNDITQDKSGFIWLATNHGVSRFNGSKFTLYSKKNSGTGLNSNDNNVIQADSSRNKVWIGNRWAGINVFDCVSETFTSYTNNSNDPNALSSNEIWDIFVSSQGQVWVGTSRGLELYSDEIDGFIHYNHETLPGFPGAGVVSITEGSAGELYLGHSNNHGLTIFNPATKAIRNFLRNPADKNSIPDNTINAIHVCHHSMVWLATNSGLSRFNPATSEFINLKDITSIYQSIRNRVVDVYVDKQGRLWAGTTSDLCYFEIDDFPEIAAGKKDVNHMFIKNIYQGIANPTVLAIFEDSFRNIWIGSNGGGASIVTHSKSFFNYWTIDKIPGTVNGLNDKEVMTICVDKDENIWMGTDGGGLNVNINGRNSAFYSATTGDVSSNTYQSSLRDSDDNLWFGAQSFIDVYKHNEKKFTGYKPMTGNSGIFALLEDSKRNIWIGNNVGIEIYNLDSHVKRLINAGNSKLPSDFIRALARDKYENVWIGTLNKGLALYNPSSEAILLPDNKSILSECRINQLFKDSKNRMWAATNEGLFLFPDNHMDNYVLYSTDNGLKNNMIYSIQEDLNGNIWMSTHYGISNLILETEQILNYDQTDGALFGSYMSNSSAIAADGTIYFGSINGVCYFNPGNKIEREKLPKVVFNGFTVHSKSLNGEPVDLNYPVLIGEVNLHYRQNNFTVGFNVMDISLQGKIEYSYRMEELNQSWTTIGIDNKITFRDVPFRNYKLHVRARYKNENWNNEYSTLSINVYPPFWLRWWAKMIYVLLMVVGIIGMIRSYKRRLKTKNSLLLEKERAQKLLEMNEERMRFYANITHELKTPLTLMLGPLEDLQNDPVMQSEFHKKISLIHKSTIRLLNLVTQILEFRKTETQNKKLYVMRGDIARLIHEIIQKYQELNRNKDVQIVVTITAPKTILYFDPEVITMIIDNLLSNALKFTSEGTITITVDSLLKNNINYTEIVVADTGCGIAEEVLSHIFERYYNPRQKKNVPGFGIGLSLVKNLVELHEAEISVESKPNEGATFRILLLTDNSYPEANHIYDTTVENVDESAHKPVVLIVEDDADMREYIADVLKDSYEVLLAGNGEEGLTIAQTKIPDAIISDVMMPVMDGMEFCRLIKNDVATSHIPVILLTAKDGLLDKTEGYTVGANSYITKPFSGALLRSRMANLLEEHKKIASLFAHGDSLKRMQLKESLTKIDNEFIEKFTRLIENNLMEEKINTPEIAQELSMSYSTLYRKVKALTGMSTSEFVRKIRILKAEELLLSGKYNISETANLVGVNSMSYFRECFKEELGMSPSEYLKKIKEG